jgi:hypothetical protein
VAGNERDSSRLMKDKRVRQDVQNEKNEQQEVKISTKN